MCSFIRDERGVTEPYTDLPALGIVAVGLIIFAYLIFSAYSSYASSAYYASVKDDLRAMARTAANDPLYTDGRPGMLDACRLDNASKKGDLTIHGYPGTVVEIIVDAGEFRWSIGNASNGTSASSQLPVTVMLNDARCVSGTLTVTMWER